MMVTGKIWKDRAIKEELKPDHSRASLGIHPQPSHWKMVSKKNVGHLTQLTSRTATILPCHRPPPG